MKIKTINTGKIIKSKKKYYKPSEIIFIVLLSLWFGVLIFRSFIHIERIYKEIYYPIPAYLDEVKICGEKRKFENIEKQRLFNYLHIGKVCEE